MKGSIKFRTSGFSLILIIILIITFSHPGLTASVEGPDLDAPYLLGDYDGNIQIMPDIPELEDHSNFLETQGIRSKNVGLMYLLVEPGLYPNITDDVARYICDIESEGYTVELYTEVWNDEFDVKTLLQTGYGEGMVGAFLVGDIPSARYEIANDFNEYGYAEFPIDLFYMDLDGTWIDSDSNDIFDDHTAGTGDIEADVWVGRLYASSITIPAENEVTLIKNYFYKNHEYRMGNTSLYDRALVYVDDDWIPWSNSYNADVGLRYDNRTFINDPEETIAPDYLSRIIRDYVIYYMEIINETVYGPSIGGETGPLWLDNAPVENCSLYVEIEGEWIWLEGGSDYYLNYETGEIDISPISPMDAGWSFYSYYNYTIFDDIDDGSLLFTENETVYGPSIGGESGPLWLDNTPVEDCSLYVEIEGEWIWLEEGSDYFLDPVTGEIDISPIAPMDAGWTFYAYYNSSQTLSGYYDWVSLFAHSAWYYHGFYYNSGASWSTLHNNEISGAETMAHFYNLFCCSAGEFTETGSNGCLAGHYVFSGTHSVCAIASAKTGSMLNFGDFYTPLGQGASIGDSFLQWFQWNAETGAGVDSRSWFYGMTIAGDPTLDTFDDVLPESPMDMKLELSGDDIEISWGQSPSPDIHHYEVFKSSSVSPFNFSSPIYVNNNPRYQPGNSFVDVNAGSDPSSSFYIVRAVDYAMNSDGNMDIIGKFYNPLEIDFWNLISLPFQPTDMDVESVLADLDFDSVKYYTQDNGWQSYSPYRPEPFNDLDCINNTMGFWVNSNSDRMVSFGAVPGITLIPLKAGWNLIGYPTLTSRLASDALAGTGADMVSIYNGTAPYLIEDRTDLSTVTMQPGQGYWVRVPVDTVWTVDW